MNFILDLYNLLPDIEKELFKEVLNDFLEGLKIIEKNKGKKSIKQIKQEKNSKEVIELGNSILLNEGFTEKDLEKINIDIFFKEIFGIENKLEEKIIFFPVYKGKEINNKNTSRFIIRRDFINLLNEKGIIKISPLNIIREFNLLLSGNSENISIEFKEKLEEIIVDLKNNYGKDIIDKDLEITKNAEKKLDLVIFKKEIIEELIEKIKNLELKEFQYKNNSLMYGGKIIYTPKEYSDRDKFLEILFSEKKGTYFKINTIYNFIEGGGSDKIYLKEEESKKIYNIKDKINEIIKKKTLIKKNFSLGKLDNKGKICRNY